MRIDAIIDAATDIVRMLRDYRGDRRVYRELSVDLMVYGYLQGRFEHITRQHYVRMHSRPRPQRIDFRHGTSNPMVMEFAIRGPDGGTALYGSQNEDELRKLTRVIPSQARKRVLLLLDLNYRPLQMDSLKPTYDRVNSGRGRFRRHPVRVIYVHDELQYHFRWRP